MNVPMLHFSSYRMQGPWFHLVTADERSNTLGMHTHDFPEIFWISQGHCHHEVNGCTFVLNRSDLVLLRPDDKHRIYSIAGSGFRFTNLAFAPTVYDDFSRRYPEVYQDLYSAHEFPHTLSLTEGEMSRLVMEVQQLASETHSRMRLERALLGIWLNFAPGHFASIATNTLPEWLGDALVSIKEPAVFIHGVPAFNKVAGRSPSHVSRECRRLLGQTPSQIVNAERMRHAAYLLRMSHMSVGEVAWQCGFSDHARFYRLFKLQFGVSPRRYRIIY